VGILIRLGVVVTVKSIVLEIILNKMEFIWLFEDWLLSKPGREHVWKNGFGIQNLMTFLPLPTLHKLR
jgi:hypothetical protein